MPIGLPDRGSRACDIAARTRLGPRRSSVFPAPPRPILDAGTYEDACAIGRRLDGRALSRQAFNLLPKIIEVDAVMTRRRQQHTIEAHPELAFAACLGTPPAHAKRTSEGRAERLAALRSAGVGPAIEAQARGAAGDDVLDAAVLTLVARRLALGEIERLGDGSRDAKGLRMEIVI
jgi:predicted RNase H-like nuclease